MGTSKLQVVNQALVKALCPMMTDLTDETDEGDFVRLVYETIYRRHVSVYHWDFARTMQLLQGPVLLADGVTVDEPLARWAFQYPKPTEPECLSVVAVLVDDKPIDYGIFGERVLTDADARETDIVIDFVFRAPEESWPDFFTSFFVDMLASEIAAGVREDLERSTQLKNNALADLRTARFTNAKQRPSRRLGRSRLARLRVIR